MKSLSEYFDTSILMSGTPSEPMKVITENEDSDPRYHSCGCPIYEAVICGYITRPTLNLVECSKNQYNSAILAVYENEKNLQDSSAVKWPIHIIANCSGIDEVNEIHMNCWESFAKDRGIHLISVHSVKTVEHELTKEEIRIIPRLDDETDLEKILKKYRKEIDSWKNEDKVNHKEPSCMMNILELIDAGVILAGEPVVLFQVDMISEGINLCSFNAGLITSRAEVKTMQQIGRILRDYTFTDSAGVEHHKKIDGHANIYSIFDNEYDVCDLLERLEEFELTDNSFDWGRKVSIHNGSAPEPDPGAIAGRVTFNWEDIEPVTIQEYRELFRNRKYDKESRNIPTTVLANIPCWFSSEEIGLFDLYMKGKISDYDSKKRKHAKSNVDGAVKDEEEKDNKDNGNNGNNAVKPKKDKKRKDMEKSYQEMLTRIRQDIIYYQLESNVMNGWKWWTECKEDFIGCFIAEGNKNLTKAILTLLDRCGQYMHLDMNPNKAK